MVIRLSRNARIFVLNFATLFQCAIIPLKSKSQTASVNALLINPESKIISTASGSNFVTGKRAIPDDYHLALVSLSAEKLASRLTYIGIFEYNRMCNVILHLVKYAKISSTQRERLIGAYKNSEQIEFIKSVIKTAADCKETTQLSNTDIDHLAEFASVESAAEFPNSKLSAKTRIKTDRDFFGSPVVSIHQELNMPWGFIINPSGV